MLAELKINLPAPSLIKLLAPLITLLIVTSPTPPNVNPVVFATPPLMVNVPVPEAISVLILEAAVVVITPDKVVAPLVLGIHMAPLPTPVPLKENGSATVSVPTMFTAAPELTVVDPAAVPKAAAFLTLIAPLLTVVKPVYVLVPVNARVSLPVFVNLPAPLITPSIRIALMASAVKV